MKNKANGSEESNQIKIKSAKSLLTENAFCTQKKKQYRVNVSVIQDGKEAAVYFCAGEAGG